MLNTENVPSRVIQDIRYAGESPYVQYDILDARTLLRMFQSTAPHLYLNSRRLGRILKGLDMWLVPGVHHVCGQQCRLWTCLPHQTIRGLVRIMRSRVQTGAADLGTHLNASHDTIAPRLEPIPLLPTFERDILALRIQRQGLRYPRPREIAQKMECATFQVNHALQTIRRRLGLKTLKDTAALREAVHKSGALMDDPAFQ